MDDDAISFVSLRVNDDLTITTALRSLVELRILEITRGERPQLKVGIVRIVADSDKHRLEVGKVATLRICNPGRNLPPDSVAGYITENGSVDTISRGYHGVLSQVRGSAGFKIVSARKT
jgi:hypothetical protein